MAATWRITRPARSAEALPDLQADNPVIREEVAHVKDADHVMFQSYVSTKHLAREPASRSHRKTGDLQCVEEKGEMFRLTGLPR